MGICFPVDAAVGAECQKGAEIGFLFPENEEICVAKAVVEKSFSWFLNRNCSPYLFLLSDKDIDRKIMK
jgi:hypothetical protein